MRKYLVIAITLSVLLITTGIAQAAPKVVLNGQGLKFEVPPTIENGRTLVPLRAIFEALGANIKWDDNTQTITATKPGTEIKLIIGGQTYKNGQQISLDVPAKIINGRTLVPLRFVSEAMGCQVDWDGDTETITINASSNTTQSEFVKWTPEQVIAAFKSAELEAENTRAMTSKDYGLAPMIAKEGIRFYIPSLGPDKGGRLYSFENQEKLNIMKDYYVKAGETSAMFFSWVFAKDNILIQINGDLDESKAKQYEAALNSLK